MLYGIILVVHILVSFILIAVILLQAGRGGGLSDAFGGSAQSILGTRGTTYLTRATTVCATIFMLTSLSLAVLSVDQGKSLMTMRAVRQSPAKPGPISPVNPDEPAPQPEQKTDDANPASQTETQTSEPAQGKSGSQQ